MSSHNRMYLLGAGFSMAISAGQPAPYKMPGMQDLTEGVLAFLRNTHPRRRIPSVADVETFETLEQLARDLTKDGPSDHLFTIRKAYESIRQATLSSAFPGLGTPLVNNFEQWLSYLIESPPWLTPGDQARNRAAFLDIAEAVGHVLEASQRGTVDAQERTGCPGWLAKLVGYWEDTSATVITFNYDRLVELAWTASVKRQGPRWDSWDLYPIPVTPLAARLGIPHRAVHCTPGEFQLFKLHGSLGWWYSGPDGPPADTIYDQGMLGGRWCLEGLELVGELPHSLLEDREQMIVPPAAVKSPYYNNSALRMMWRSAAAQLSIADELVIMGFSLPATDMLVSSMLCTNIRSTCKITPVDYGEAIVDRVCTVFGIKPNSDRLNLKYVNMGIDAIPSWVEENVEI